MPSYASTTLTVCLILRLTCCCTSTLFATEFLSNDEADLPYFASVNFTTGVVTNLSAIAIYYDSRDLGTLGISAYDQHNDIYYWSDGPPSSNLIWRIDTLNNMVLLPIKLDSQIVQRLDYDNTVGTLCAVTYNTSISPVVMSLSTVKDDSVHRVYDFSGYVTSAAVANSTYYAVELLSNSAANISSIDIASGQLKSQVSYNGPEIIFAAYDSGQLVVVAQSCSSPANCSTYFGLVDPATGLFNLTEAHIHSHVTLLPVAMTFDLPAKDIYMYSLVIYGAKSATGFFKYNLNSQTLAYRKSSHAVTSLEVAYNRSTE